MSNFSNPNNTLEPYYFASEEGHIEGAAHHITSIFKSFEPIDVLNGKTRIYDSNGLEMILVTDDQSIVDKNEYPSDYSGIDYKLLGIDESVLQMIARADQIEFID